MGLGRPIRLQFYSVTISISPAPVMSPNVAGIRTWPTARGTNCAGESASIDTLSSGIGNTRTSPIRGATA